MTVIPRKRPAAVPGLARTTASSLMGGTLRRGPDVAEFEAVVSQRLEGRHVSAVGSGRLALIMVLDALGVEPGATIYLPSYTASCVPNVLQAAGFQLHFVDIERSTLHLDPGKLPDAAEGGGALVLTHIEGSPMRLEKVMAWAAQHDIKVIEDAAHALGAKLNGRPVGTLADGAIFSLGRGKHLNTLGGGLAVVADPGAGERLKALAEQLDPASGGELLKAVVMEGMVETGTAPAMFGLFALPVMKIARRFGSDPMTKLFEDDTSAMAAIPRPMRKRLSNLQARFGLDSLAGFDAQLDQRRRHAETLRQALGDRLPLQQPNEGAEPAWLELTALVEDRERFQSLLLAKGVDTQRTWMDACDALPAFSGAAGGTCEVAREVGRQAVYLPTYASLTERQVSLLGETVLEVLEKMEGSQA